MILIVIWSVCLLIAVHLYLKSVYSRFSKYGVNTDKPVPFFGNSASVIFRRKHFVDMVHDLYHMYPQDRFVGLFNFLDHQLIITDIELIKKITIKDFEHFIDHRSFIDENTDPFFGKNLISLKGAKWKDMRSTLSPAFTSSKIRAMVPFMNEVSDDMIRALKKTIQESNDDYIDIDVKDLSTRFANDVIASCAFGLKVDSYTNRDNHFYKMGKETSTFKLRAMLLFFMYLAFPNFTKQLKLSLFSQASKDFFKDLVLDTMKDREMKNIIRPDMIHLLMEAKKGHLTHDKNVTKDEDAGFATVEESSVGKKTIDRELLRLWSPAGVLDRVCEKDYNIGKPNDKATQDYIIRKGDGIGIPVWQIHRDPKYFPDPLKFDPERFSEENKHNIKPFTYMPFGVGPRNCIGSRFALCEMKIMTYQLLKYIELSPATKTMVPAELSLDTFNIRIKNGHWARLKLRN